MFYPFCRCRYKLRFGSVCFEKRELLGAQGAVLPTGQCGVERNAAKADTLKVGDAVVDGLKHPLDLRKWLSNFPDGMLSFLGCHLIDLIYTIQGEPEEIIPLSCTTGTDGLSTTDFGMVVFRYPNGISFAKTCDNEVSGFLRRQLVITGEKGTIEIRPLEVHTPNGLYTLAAENYDNGGGTPTLPARSEMYDRYLDMMKNFAEMIRGKGNPYSYEYELKLYDLILRSCRKEI